MSEHWVLPVVAAAVAIAGLYVYLRLGREHYGPDADWWEIVRRSALPQLNRLARRNGLGYAAYRLSKAEYVGSVEEPVEEWESLVWGAGYERMPLAAFKYAPDGRPEQGSWAWRPSMLSKYQLHVIPFAGHDGGTDVYAHFEYNAYNPLYAAAHYLGTTYYPLGDRGPVLVEELILDPEDVYRAFERQYD